MRARSVLAASLACATLACAGPPPAPRATLVKLAPPSAEPAPPVVPPPATSAHVDRAVVAVSLLTSEGDGFWGAQLRPAAAPETLVRPCYESALRIHPRTAGWVLIDLDYMHHEAKPLERAGLSDPLVSCIVASLTPLEIDDGYRVGRCSVYVSLSPE